MNVPSPRNLLRPALAAALLATLAGCVSTPSPGLGTLGRGNDDSTFDAAGDRAPTVGSMHSMARLCISQGRDRDAENVLQNILEQQVDFLPAYEELAQIYLRADMVDSAVAELRAGLVIAPRDAVFLNDLGMCQLLQHDYVSALDNFTQAAGRCPTNARCRANMAVALGMLGRTDEALSLYLQVLPPADAHWNVAVLCDANRNAERALREYVRAGQPMPLTEPLTQ